MLDRYGREWVTLPPPVNQVLDTSRACQHGEPRGLKGCALCRAASAKAHRDRLAAAANQMTLPIRHLHLVQSR